MYAICGAISDAKKAFSSMDERDLVSWNSLLSGCAHHGYGREAVQLFEQMQKTEITPDGTTFLVVLSACCHAVFIDKGLQYFYLMRNDASLESPRAEHYAAIVGLLGRAGFLNEAESFINSMSTDPGPSVYIALLSACQLHGNRELMYVLQKGFWICGLMTLLFMCCSQMCQKQHVVGMMPETCAH